MVNNDYIDLENSGYGKTKQNLKMMKKRLIFLCFIPLIIITGCKSGSPKKTKQEVIYVNTVTPRQKKVKIPIHSSGKVHAAEEIKLSFKTGGIIDKIDVKEGQAVKKGDLLASLNLLEIEANVKQAREMSEKANRDFRRAENLYKDSVATLEQFENAKTALEIAQSNLQIATFNLRHSKIIAPTDGRILMRLKEENEMIAQGHPVFLFGTRQNQWIVKTSIPDKEIVRINIGDSAQIFLDAYPEMHFTGTVTETGEFADPYTGTFEVEIMFDTSGKRVSSGFIAKVSVYPENQTDYFSIPVEALSEADQMSAFIYVLDGDQYHKKPVNISIIENDHVLIEKGLTGTEKIITDGIDYLTREAIIKEVNE